MARSNLAMPLAGAFVIDPTRVAAVGLVLSLMVMLSATFISCPDALRNDTTTGNGSPGRAYGKRSTFSHNPGVFPAVWTSRPASFVRICPADWPGELQAWFATSAATAPSANKSFSRFTEIPLGTKLVDGGLLEAAFAQCA